MASGGLYLPIEIWQGEDWVATIPVTDPNNNDAPVDVRTGYIFTGQVGKEHFTADQILYEWKVENDNVELGNGWVKLKIPATDSRQWSFRRVFYDVEVRNSVTGAEIIVAHGPLVLEPTFARPTA